MKCTMTTVGNSTATRGVLNVQGRTFYTVEQPWNDNNEDKSCVPAGTYQLIPYLSPKHGSTWCLHNPGLNIYGMGDIPLGGRSYVEIHSANWAEQLEGCIALGMTGHPTLDPLTGIVEPAVEESRDAIAAFTQILGPMTSGHTLNINRSQG